METLLLRHGWNRSVKVSLVYFPVKFGFFYFVSANLTTNNPKNSFLPNLSGVGVVYS